MKKSLPAVLAALLLGAGVWAQQVVDQGQPGNQGPWPVSITGTIVVNFDGGFIGSTATAPCSVIAEANTSVGTSAIPVPAAPLAGRSWIRICNSLLNSGSTQCICSASTCPTFAAASVGDPLATSDCVTYNLGFADAGVPCCICNGAASRMPSEECKVP